MVPLPAIVFNSLDQPLQLLASFTATHVARIFGVAVYQDGNIIQLATTTLGVAEACSGLRSMSLPGDYGSAPRLHAVPPSSDPDISVDPRIADCSLRECPARFRNRHPRRLQSGVGHGLHPNLLSARLELAETLVTSGGAQSGLQILDQTPQGQAQMKSQPSVEPYVHWRPRFNAVEFNPQYFHKSAFCCMPLGSPVSVAVEEK
jgi:hypothetical protein